MKAQGVGRETADKFHLAMWALVHGIAVMYATAYLSPNETVVSEMLTDVYNGLSTVYKERNKNNEDD